LNQASFQDVTITGWTVITSNPMFIGINTTNGIGYSMSFNRVTFRDFITYDLIGFVDTSFGNITLVDCTILRVTISHYGFIYLNNGYLLSPYYISFLRTNFINCTGIIATLYGTGTPMSFVMTDSSIMGLNTNSCLFSFTGFLRGAPILPNFVIQLTNTSIISNTIYNGSVFCDRTGFPGYNNSVGVSITLTNSTVCNNLISPGYYPEVVTTFSRGNDGSMTIIGGTHQSLGDLKSNFYQYSIQGASNCTSSQTDVTVPLSSDTSSNPVTNSPVTSFPPITYPPTPTVTGSTVQIASGTILELSFLLVSLLIYINQ